MSSGVINFNYAFLEVNDYQIEVSGNKGSVSFNNPVVNFDLGDTVKARVFTRTNGDISPFVTLPVGSHGENKRNRRYNIWLSSFNDGKDITLVIRDVSIYKNTHKLYFKFGDGATPSATPSVNVTFKSENGVGFNNPSLSTLYNPQLTLIKDGKEGPVYVLETNDDPCQSYLITGSAGNVLSSTLIKSGGQSVCNNPSV